MANNYTQASFTILCSQEQAQMALDAIAYVTDTDVSEGDHLLSKPASECSLTELLVWVLFRTTRSAIRLSRLLVSRSHQKTITSWNSKRKSPVAVWQSAMMKALTSTTQSR